MGVVFLGYDPELDRRVALKLVRSGRDASQGRARVKQEAQAMAQVSHPNIVHVYEVGESTDDVFIAMEYVAGVTLSTWQQQGARTARPVAQTLRVYLQAGAGLLAAHQAGLIHRDFKPDNVLVDHNGRAHVLDFGLARALRGPALDLTSAGIRPTDAATGASGERLTQEGAIMGTPGYMSPEQVQGAEADARSDQFSFCAALYEALYNQLPYGGETFEEFAAEVMAGRLRPPPSAELPLLIERAILRGLASDPAARFPSMKELCSAIEEGLSPDSESLATRRASRWFAGIVVLCSLFAAVIALRSRYRFVDGTMASALLISSVYATGFLGALLSLRRTLLRRTTYRRVAYFGLVTLGYMQLSRLAAYSKGMTLGHYVPLELLGLAALLLIEAPKLSWYYVWLAVLACGGAALVLARPQLPVAVGSIFFVLLSVGCVYFALTRPPRTASRPSRSSPRIG
jgi:predicted Ser/Thr protein kinase